jgi:hypothetical protein
MNHLVVAINILRKYQPLTAEMVLTISDLFGDSDLAIRWYSDDLRLWELDAWVPREREAWMINLDFKGGPPGGFGWYTGSLATVAYDIVARAMLGRGLEWTRRLLTEKLG